MSFWIFLFIAASAHASDLLSETYEQDLQQLSLIQSVGESPLHHQVFGGAGGEAYSVFFRGRIHRMQLLEDPLPGEVARFEPGSITHVVQLSSKYPTIPQIYRLGVLLHEARHVEEESGYWPHSICPDEMVDGAGRPAVGLFSHLPLAGRAKCDSTAWGAYGIQTLFYGNIAKYCVSCDPQTKQDARRFAIDTLNRITNADARKALAEDLDLK